MFLMQEQIWAIVLLCGSPEERSVHFSFKMI